MTEEEAALTTVFDDDKATKRRLRRSRLVVIDGPDAGTELQIERERVTVGRSVICDLTLTDKAVSGTHCEVVASERGFIIRDLDSTNGTFCGDLRVGEAWMTAGTTLRAGQTHLRFEPAQGTVEIDISSRERFCGLVGKSLRMREIFAILEKVGPTDLTVLVRGETGTGKELVAQAVHQASGRASGPFVVQDCGAIPKDLIESTLFGHEKGSFTGATERHRGSFEAATGGTIFLDEIGELDISLQPKLLRVLESKEVKRVGSNQVTPVDVRVVAATNRDLRKMVEEGSFREDLYYRLSVVQIDIPPLRERPEDIAPIVADFLRSFDERMKRSPEQAFCIARDALVSLESHRWPGNVRELRNVMERAASLTDASEITLKDLSPNFQRAPTASAAGANAALFVEENLPFKAAKQRVIDAFEASYLRALLDKYDGNITRSANAAGLTRYHLRELAKRFGIRGSSD